MLANDQTNTVLCELSQDGRNEAVYSAYGHRANEAALSSHLGYNGERREVQTGWYMLGNGYRVSNPVLMRFHSPDSWSPFGDGGLNAYSYTMGDPINYTDPLGHFKWAVLLGMLMNTGDDAVLRTSQAIGSSSRGVSSLAASGTADILESRGFLQYTGKSVASAPSVSTKTSAGPLGSAGSSGVPARPSRVAPPTPGSSRGAYLDPKAISTPRDPAVPRVKEAPKAQPVTTVQKAPPQVTDKQFRNMNVFDREKYFKKGGVAPESGKYMELRRKQCLI